MWEATVDGKPLHFRLAGINNQNFIMRDEETGSWWQQINGVAFLGPLKGKKLQPVLTDEISFAIWKRENNRGRVLRPDSKITEAGRYAPADWEERMLKNPVVTPAAPGDKLPPRTLISGIEIKGMAKAFPMHLLEKHPVTLDSLNGTALLLWVGEDRKSVRAFERKLGGRQLEFFAKTDTGQPTLVDAETGSEWDFTGTAIRGPLTGQKLKPIPVLKDYWFDWKLYHPGTLVMEKQ